MKAKILAALRNAEGYISGQDLCDQLGVSRTAIWKVIKQLKDEGYEVEAKQNRGYRIVTIPDILSESELKSQMRTVIMGQKIYYFESIDSTNTYAKKIADEQPEGTLVITEAQKSGKGSRGRSWDAPSGSGVWMSIILKPDILPSHASKLTLVMALSVARACKQYLNVDVQIKWPNDIVYHGKKVCGILTEMSSESDYINHIVIGVGINVNTKEFPKEIQDTATSFYNETKQIYNRAGLTVRIMQCFEADYKIFLETQDLSKLIEEYTAYSVTIGSDVKVLNKKEAYNGKALYINPEGQLLVQKDDGTRILVFADEVSVRGLYGYV